MVRRILNFPLYSALASLPEIVICDAIVEKCVVMDLSVELGMVFVSHFPNVIESD